TILDQREREKPTCKCRGRALITEGIAAKCESLRERERERERERDGIFEGETESQER
ncbi:hypothetical protein TorRG33x02_027610, partial [Trema orientale]